MRRLRHRRGGVLARDAAARGGRAARGDAPRHPGVRDRPARRARSASRARASIRATSKPTSAPSGCSASSSRKTAATGSARRCARSCVFAPHNLLADPPFSRLDLIACRNLLIYLQRDAAARGHRALPLRAAAGRLPGARHLRDDRRRRAVPRRRQAALRSTARRNVPAPEPRLPVFPVSAARGRAPRRRRGAQPRARAQPTARCTAACVERVRARRACSSSPDDSVVHLSEHAGRYLAAPGGRLTTSVRQAGARASCASSCARRCTLRARTAASAVRADPVVDVQLRRRRARSSSTCVPRRSRTRRVRAGDVRRADARSDRQRPSRCDRQRRATERCASWSRDARAGSGCRRSSRSTRPARRR